LLISGLAKCKNGFVGKNRRMSTDRPKPTSNARTVYAKVW